MERRKKKPDKLIAGFLALLTAFSPVASVIPVYASGLDSDSTSSSLTMDPDSIQIDETGSGSGSTGSDGIVIDSDTEGSDDISIVDDGDGSYGITIGDESNGSGGIATENPDDGIDIGESDGIAIENPDDGISINEPEDDGIIFDDEGVTLDDDGNISIDPWYGIDETADDKYFDEHPEEFEYYEVSSRLSVDIRSIHGSVVLTPVFYTAVINDIGGIAWPEFVDSGSEYDVQILVDKGIELADTYYVKTQKTA